MSLQQSLQHNMLGAGLRVNRAVSGVSVTYTRNGDSVALKAIPGRSEWDQMQDEHVIREFTTADWIFEWSDCGSTFGEPEPGDRVARDSEIWEVMSPGGQRAWRWVCPGGLQTWIRVHTKRVE